MSRITKTLAESIARQLMEKKKERIAQKRKELQDIVTDTITDSIPNHVLDFFKSNKKWMRTSQDFRLKSEGSGTDYAYHQTNTELPTCSDYNWLDIPAEKHKKILGLSEKIERMHSEYRRVTKEVETAIFNLRTYSNLEKEFPEAAKLLPKSGSTAIAVNIDKVRQLIK